MIFCSISFHQYFGLSCMQADISNIREWPEFYNYSKYYIIKMNLYVFVLKRGFLNVLCIPYRCNTASDKNSYNIINRQLNY